ncbi:hypothetical protein E4U52_004060 [Claviceps spartinae]|nr:hypothetical protein E4U52_004060 [Claviceps spartinae]
MVNEEFVPIVWKAAWAKIQTDHIALLAQPPVPPAATDPLGSLEPLKMKVDVLYLQKPSHPGAPDGLYDLLIAGKQPRLVAMDRSGMFRLTITAPPPGSNANLLTTIFRVNCEGQITLEVEGQPYSWALLPYPDSRVQAIPGNADYNHVKAVPANHPVNEKARGDNMRHVPPNRDHVPSPSNAAPKCPSAPAGLTPRLHHNQQPDLGNICRNTANLWRAGMFNFTSACASQSRCYDQCDSYDWESYNDFFVGEAMSYCFDHWGKTHWDIVVLLACTLQAKYYGMYLSGRGGKELFYQAQKGMCSCTCNKTNTTAMCSIDNHPICADIGVNDPKNCGACGRTCGPGSVCRKGRCVPMPNAGLPAWTSRTVPSTADAAGRDVIPDTTHIRIFDPFKEPQDSLDRLESRVKDWSDHIQQTSTDLLQSGLAIAVDECMVRYTERSRAKKIIPRKPMPQGLKVEKENAATCTARLSSGIWVEFVKSKELDTVCKLDFVEVVGCDRTRS